MKKKSHRLSVEPDFNFFLVGISSHENDYHLCWTINQHLNLNLQKTNNLRLVNPKSKLLQEFSMYAYEDDDSLLVYHLLSNRCDNGFLLEEMKNIDFLIQIYGDIPEADQQYLIEDLNRMDIINTSFKIDPWKLKSRDKLVIQ